MNAPLLGVTVVDLSQQLAGPFCSMILGDLGASVIKVEKPGGDDTRQWGPPFWAGESCYFLSINRGKRSVVIDLKRPAGRDVLTRLLQRGDVLVENFRPGAMDRLGFGWEAAHRLNPRLVYCSISAFGGDGPYRDRPGYEALMQAYSGLMSITGRPGDEPVRAGTSISDIGAGMYAAIGILAALIARRETGAGQLVETSLLEGQVAWLSFHAVSYFATGENPPRLGTASPYVAPYETFRTRDQHLMLAVGNDSLWQRMCDAMGLAHLAVDPRFATNPERCRHRDELAAILQERFLEGGRDEWVAILNAAGVPCGPINTVGETLADPQVRHRGMVAEFEHPRVGKLRMPGNPIRLSGAPWRPQSAPPLLGADTDAVLADFGYSSAEIKALRAAGAVG
jgi:formyl-CoA transferase/CoA:oxalate CoA-transferase